MINYLDSATVEVMLTKLQNHMAKNILTWAVDHNSKIILYLEKFTLKPQLSLLRVANLRLQNCIISFSSIGISLYQNHADATRYSTC